MNTRWSRWFWVVAVVASVMVLGARATEASHLKENPKKHKVVYHLNEPGVAKALFVLGNIRNHIKGVGGWENIETLELVVHGPALKTFVTKEMDPQVKRALEQLQTQGLTFGACGNTMKAFNIKLEELPDGSKHLPQGGVVRVMELQEQGYAYVRPWRATADVERSWWGARRRPGPPSGRCVAVCLAWTPGALAAAAADTDDLLWDLQIVPLDGPPAPAFTLESLDGTKVSLDDFRGRVVLLYFWAST